MVSLVLDTNSVIAYINGDVDVARRIELTPELLLPSIVIGEMVYGANESARRDENIELLRQFTSACTVIDCGEGSAYEYGKIKSDLNKRGKRIPENDMWIAACALVANTALLSRDAHFDAIDGLTRIDW